jgi:hypothetical protein
MLQKNPSLTTAELLGILRDTAEDMSLRFVNLATPSGPVTEVFPIGDPDPEGFDFDTGHGFVDAAGALEATPDGG